jgi:hypothetical protein
LSSNKESFILMSYKEIKEIHVKEQIRHQKPLGYNFEPGDYVSIDREKMIVYNIQCPKYKHNIKNLYGVVSLDESTNNSQRDYINIVRFTLEGKSGEEIDSEEIRERFNLELGKKK